MPEAIDRVQEAWARYAAELIKMPGVISVHPGHRERGGKMTDEPALVVTVVRKIAIEDLAPAEVCPPEVRLSGGVTVGTDVVEDLSGYPTVEQDDAGYRPVPGGCSIGNMAVRGIVGTLGGWFCQRQGEGSGWQPVWLSNAHVVDVTNQNAVPADPRVDQPVNSSDVIGNTIAVSGWPAAVAGPGVVLNGFMDAAIGDLDEEIDPDYQVLQIGDAPFELGTAAANEAVQKRGRTSRLTQGTIFSPNVTVNVGDGRAGGGGVVTFGLPGQPAVSRIDSNATGLAAAFGRPGDSGSLVFAQAAGRLASTVPCLGLYFAGNFRWVSNQPNPNALTVRGYMFNIQAVVQQFQLELVCACVARQIIEAIFGRRRAGSESGRTELVETSMRGFRDRVMARTPRGKIIADAVAEAAPAMARVLAQDPESFEMVVELLEPYVEERIGLGLLARKLEPESVELAQRLAERVTSLSPELERQADPTLELLRKHEGKSIGRMMGNLRKVDLDGNAKAAEKDAAAARKKRSTRKRG